jgi:2-C-methyl-D-erythritol 4-phosphate cytidylyltransferase
VWNIKTPQAFNYTMIRAAYEILKEGSMAGITDDAMVIERSGLGRVKLVMGSYSNIKITTPEDLGLLSG